MKIGLVMMVALISVAGCKSGVRFETYQGRAIIDTTPPGADVYVVDLFKQNTRYWLGMTPIKDVGIMAFRDVVIEDVSSPEAYKIFTNMNSAIIEVEKEGFKRYRGRIGLDKESVTELHINLEPEK